MIVDSSVLVAMLRNEREAPAFEDALARSVARMSAATYLEAGIVIDAARDPVLSRRLDDVIVNAEISIEPVTAEHARIARQAYRDFGRGSGHAARLNFGDCFAYALARERGEPLLYKGDNFSHTDIAAAV